MIKNKLIILLIILLNPSFPCSDFQIIAEDGSIIYGRTMDFAVIANAGLKLFKSGTKLSSSSPSGQKTFKTKTSISFCVVTGFGNNKLVAQGINEKGLTISVLWHPAGTQYIDPALIYDSKNAMEVTDLIPMILGGFDDITLLKNFLENIDLWSKIYPELGNTSPTTHFVAYDKTGKGLVVEYENGKIKTYDPRFGILTNSPSYNWHLTNMQNYIDLLNTDVEEITVNKVIFKKIGIGGGLQGMPGDQTSPSRFIRLFTIKRFMEKPKTRKDAIAAVSYIIGNVFSIYGVIKTIKNQVSFSQWSLITDTDNLIYYIKLYGDLNWTKFDLKENLFNKEDKFEISFKEIVESN